MRRLLSGNEAVALGAYESGVTAAFGYPGTPSTEILENLVKYEGVYCEWSPNEKVALEAAAGASIAGARALVTMKLVGLNVAADPMMTLSYIGVAGGLVIVVADDPGQHSSQTEQDTRHYARLAKIPLFDPADALEARDFICAAFDFSEKYRTPVILRTTTCSAHSRSFVDTREPRQKNVTRFVKNVPQFVPIPLWGRKLRRDVEERMALQSADMDADRIFNKVYPGADNSFGVISFGAAALHARELFPENPMLKLGFLWPFQDDVIRDFASKAGKILLIEEGDPILEEHIKSLGINCTGKDIVPRCGELTPARIFEVRAKFTGSAETLPAPVEEASDLPSRPPVLCPGCPHRGLFHALTKFDVIVTGDIGCYSLGVFKPLDRTDTILCMGGGFTMAHGMEKAGEKRKIVGIVGDSTFFHSGITGLLDAVYNKGTGTYIVVDNRITAMTGHQEHPGTGVTLSGETTKSASIEAVARACGVERIFVCDPYNQKELQERLSIELETPEVSLVISRAPCPLHLKKRVGPVRVIAPDKCRACGACLKCGCPAIEGIRGHKPVINPAVCQGCSLCEGLCRFGAIVKNADSQ